MTTQSYMQNDHGPLKAGRFHFTLHQNDEAHGQQNRRRGKSDYKAEPDAAPAKPERKGHGPGERQPDRPVGNQRQHRGNARILQSAEQACRHGLNAVNQLEYAGNDNEAAGIGEHFRRFRNFASRNQLARNSGMAANRMPPQIAMPQAIA